MSTLAKVSQRLNSGVAAKARVPQLILMTDDARLSDPARAMARLPRGSAVIVRTRDPHSLRNLTQRIKAQAKRRGILLLAATDVGHALRLGLDGAHLSERAARRKPMRVKTTRPGFIISASAHDRRALWRAKKAGADCALLSTVFTTESHPEKKPLGVLRFRLLVRGAPLAVIALGGIDQRNAKRLRGSGVAGIAAIGALA